MNKGLIVHSKFKFILPHMVCDIVCTKHTKFNSVIALCFHLFVMAYHADNNDYAQTP